MFYDELSHKRKRLKSMMVLPTEGWLATLKHGRVASWLGHHDVGWLGHHCIHNVDPTVLSPYLVRNNQLNALIWICGLMCCDVTSMLICHNYGKPI